jgi:DNA-directed RNA polymerase subunit M/transcription elongation factor TFIIS
MKFCKNCDSTLTPYTHTGNLVFVCSNCHSKFDAEPVDTLRVAVDYKASDSTQKYEVMKSIAAFDVAGKKVLKKCIKCSMPYMTHIYIGIHFTSTYVCVCGYEVTGSVEEETAESSTAAN